MADAEPAVRNRGSEGIAQPTRQSTRGSNMPVWAWILIILLIVFLLGGFGYSRR
jgi:purine-cytosine permease-like protein